ncbi:HlyD family efflux transporter periplasmic adaptor subunit [Roseococcus sp. SDR]|uniref:HlyD family efflux transporter periplasmic adaptor subunit n=1 Tax=Roseococcus sp. SDR TaxID=2835532 RepID=UPI001BCC523F|nr:HlyD family efflux transporter periplasmic adaptor subunit [Roseococcus sp. SDR]MBS7789936.1 HlyD family efflux transporter periplasmic adaptor subunit [Roseococcus sp. SDR]MBV1845250.1 HlyD family efflux transporter periplasmic adaptor subunit [Roseococcus sp. SDR]
MTDAPAGHVAPGFEDIARLAALLCHAPIGAVVLGERGVVAAIGATLETEPFTAASGDAFGTFPDLTADPRFAAHALVTGADALRFAAAAPLPGRRGALLVLDRKPRDLTEAEREGLHRLAARCAAELELAEREEARRGRDESLSLDYRRALDVMTDGVLAIGPDARVMTVNPAAARILEINAEEAIGQSLALLLSERDGTDDFIDAVLAPLQEEEAPQGRRVLDFPGERRLSVEATSWRVQTGPHAGRPAITAVFTDVTETERLQAELASQYTQLQDAFLKLEDSATRSARIARRIAALRIAAVAAAFLGVFGVAAWTWFSPAEPDVFAAGAGGAITMTATAQPVSARIAVVGVLEPGANVSVVAPYDGTVRERLFRYGGAVTQGEVLLRMDRGEVETRLREARAAEIRARQRVEELRGWANGFEVARARRQLAAAELETSNLRARLQQSQMLLSRGIIPAEEHRNLIQQQRNQELQLQAAQQDLAATLDRGSELHLRTAELELANAETKLREIETDLQNAEVRAPVSGVVLMPPERGAGQGRAETIEVGTRVSRGQTMFGIGDLAGFLVRGQVDEIDVNQVRPGQNVTVTGDAFAGEVLTGRVASVAAQASSDQGGMGRGMPNFAVSIAITDLTPEQRARLAVGMSASLAIITHEREDAVVLPPNAIRDENGSRVVRVREGGRVVSRPVTLGISTPEGVEVREGLSPGDVIVLRE